MYGLECNNTIILFPSWPHKSVDVHLLAVCRTTGSINPCDKLPLGWVVLLHYRDCFHPGYTSFTNILTMIRPDKLLDHRKKIITGRDSQ